MVNFLLVVPLAGMGAYYTATGSLADYLPTLADDPSINGGIYTAITVILGVIVWRRRVSKLDEAVRRFTPARSDVLSHTQCEGATLDGHPPSNILRK